MSFKYAFAIKNYSIFLNVSAEFALVISREEVFYLELS